MHLILQRWIYSAQWRYSITRRRLGAPQPLATLLPEQKTKFLPLCPDFAVELASPSDSLRTLRTKMAEYIANGAQLAWLLLPETHTVHVYRPHVPVEILQSVGLIKGDPVLPGFTLDLSDIWEPGF